MPKMTRKEKIKHYLTGFYQAKEIPSRNKYDMMEGVGRDGKTLYFFLGDKGALRISNGKNASKSTSMTEMLNFDKIDKYLEERGLLK